MVLGAREGKAVAVLTLRSVEGAVVVLRGLRICCEGLEAYSSRAIPIAGTMGGGDMGGVSPDPEFEERGKPLPGRGGDGGSGRHAPGGEKRGGGVARKALRCFAV